MRTLALVALLAIPAPEPQQGVAVTGTVVLKGEIPTARKIRMDTERHCAQLAKGEVIGDDIVADAKGRVKWAFVYVKSGLEGKTFEVPKAKAVVQQAGCHYSPHVLGIMVGQDLVIRSGDPVIHLPHVAPKNNREWAFSQAKVGEERTKTFTAPEVMVRLICDVHRWMEAWIGVLDHPFYAVTDAAGKFEIKGLPPGAYEIEVWHEKYLPVVQKIEIGAAAPKPLAFELSERRPLSDR